MKTLQMRLAGMAVILLLLSPYSSAQSHLTLPFDGGNQKSQVTQWIGLVEVTITYFSPDITSPQGENRQGKIWGQLVPYNGGDPYPWRAGANRNTTISFSHDVTIEGAPLAAGIYGLHMIPSADEWTIIFSNNATSWGSFTYNQAEDALRVAVRPEKGSYHEWLSYDFIVRRPDQAVAALKWENLQVPFKIEADVKNIYLNNIRNELRDEAGFSWQAWNEAAKFCLENEINYEEALKWVNRSISGDYFSLETSANLQTKAGLLEKMGRHEEAEKVLKKALDLGTPDELYQFARGLMREEKYEEALSVFKLSYKQHQDAWPVHLGLGRGYEGVGDRKNALKHFKLALKDAPNARQKISIGKMIEKLENRK
ncbi:DUF2911 domain-containing protein [Fulvivirgaceae bacterium BMA12]|uniref:DUF2911 domain-containing protein n=1 Tax=Agaribacillus aureus TaxID=3051825 RepID=A0ABT8LB58_9BACT|nr:DUF2911 domain-containing protein [Fulvivirgaceae bacterium BMA12]